MFILPRRLSDAPTMKNDHEFFQRAATDPAFRASHLENLRYYQQVGTGLTWTCGVLGLAACGYGGIRDGNWDLGLGLLAVATLCGSVRTVVATRAAALEMVGTMTRKENEPARSAAAGE